MEYQHFIPKSYLRYFAHSVKKKKRLKRFVDIYSLSKDELVPMTSITDVCVNKNFYTINNHKATEDQKFHLEKFYAKYVDGHFPSAYEILMDTEKKVVSKDEKYKILKCYLSLKFRTPKTFREFTEFNLTDFQNSPKHIDKDTGVVTVELSGRKFEYHKDHWADFEHKFKAESRDGFLAVHTIGWLTFIDHHMNNSLLRVNKINSDVELITSDNPVSIIHPAKYDKPDLLNPHNRISIPLDRYHYLQIYSTPNLKERSQIFREKHSNPHVAHIMNELTAKHSDDWIIGYPGALESYVKKRKEYADNHESPLNIIEFRTSEIKKLQRIIELSVGSLESTTVKKRSVHDQ